MYKALLAGILTSALLLMESDAGPCMGPGCYIRQLQAAESADCGDCDSEGNCISMTYTCPQYYACVDAGQGEAGKQYCGYQISYIATMYECTDSMDWTGFISCVAGVVGAAGCCALCIFEPTKLSCISCSLCVAAAGGNCTIQDFCDCEMSSGQTVTRLVFTALSGNICDGQ